MFDVVNSGGILMLPILFCSVLAIAVIIERAWSLSTARVMPKYALAQVWTWLKNDQLDAQRLREVRRSSPLGRLLAVGLSNSKFGRAAMVEAIELAAAQVVHELERYLETLGTIAAIAPLLGLLGTVVGMIRVFGQIMLVGTGDAGALAGGISEALVSTAAGLCVAIPAYAAHRFFLRRVDALVIGLEQESLKLVDALHSDKSVELRGAGA
ncbi:MAG: MotA/TolQ/ExbB proton channel family protein [Gammaproteobacteria bacterium]|nr:MotA/TolQ/ExbB proton channel family protein [Gammaproteobacteria bacterium]